MAQPLAPEPPRPPEEPERTLRLLQEPPERKVTGPRVRPGLRKRPTLDDTPMPARGAGMTIVSYLIAGIVAYGGIGWLIGRAVHVPLLFPIGMLVGLGISIGYIIHRFGRQQAVERPRKEITGDR